MRPFRLESSVVTFSVAAVVLVLAAAFDLHRSLPRELAGNGSTQPVRHEPLRQKGIVAWALAGGLVLAVELWELFHVPRSLYPTLSSLANELVGPGHRVGRGVAFVCWGLCGLVVASRPRRQA